jgi:hypothetical protein
VGERGIEHAYVLDHPGGHPRVWLRNSVDRHTPPSCWRRRLEPFRPTCIASVSAPHRRRSVPRVLRQRALPSSPNSPRQRRGIRRAASGCTVGTQSADSHRTCMSRSEPTSTPRGLVQIA